MLLRTRAVDRMARRSARFDRVNLHVARGEAHEDLVAPRPDAVVGRPAAEAAKLGVTLMQLETGIKQPEAITLYRRFGYAERGPFAGY